MEAPVPASSLIHSATLVSAGIYLILKFQILFTISQLNNVIFFIGSLTACYGGIVAASQTDMKKLLAYSTISHCGFIMASISLNNFLITIIYLYLHGLFKASTFFCAGSIIKTNNTQDMRLMGMNNTQIFDITSLIISTINLGGLPFTFGYLYKQTFITQLTVNTFSYFSFGFCLIGLLCSIVYVYKLIYYSCFDFRKGYLPYIILLVQNNMFLRNKFLFGFTYSKFFSFTIIYMFSMMFFFIIKYFFLKNYIFFYYIPETVTNEYKFFQNYFTLKKYIISIYYNLFTIIIIILILNNFRGNYFYHNKIEILINI
jgi:NADH:ubiquinone oxidoreductase subunit 5 (subunit L)/multisubunit Na+/H+ antiporter MnhA subunit